MTLLDLLMGWRHDQQFKHGLDFNWAKRNINELTNLELVEELSAALETLLNKQE